MFKFIKQKIAEYNQRSAESVAVEKVEFKNKHQYHLIATVIVSQAMIWDEDDDNPEYRYGTFILKENGKGQRKVDTLKAIKFFGTDYTKDCRVYSSVLAPWLAGMNFEYIPKLADIMSGEEEPLYWDLSSR
jgi:hypothetical protein